MEYALKQQLNQTIYVFTPSSVDVYGDLSFGAAATYSARVVQEQRFVEESETEGQDLYTGHIIVTDEDSPITDDDYIALTNGGDKRKPKKVITAIDAAGNVDYYLAWL